MSVILGLVLVLSILSTLVVCECDHPPVHCWSSESRFPQLPATQPCFGEEALCHCGNTTANCSLTFGLLTFVPDLRRLYQVLNFSYNNVTHISEGFFVNASRDVRVIDLYNNGLASIAAGAFRRLKRLTLLLLGGSNLVGYKEMRELLILPSLRNVSFSCVGLTSMAHDAFRGMENSSLIVFDLSWNYIESINISAFQPLHHLKEVILWHNQIYDLETAYLPSWESLDLSTNRLYRFPRTCMKSNEPQSLFPSLKNLFLQHNMISSISDPVCLPELQYISLNFNKFEYMKTNTFSRHRFPSLHVLHIIEMENKIRRMEPHFINNSEVRVINFMLNNVDFAGQVVHKDVFAGCTNVKVLLLSKNDLKDVSDQRFHRLLKPMRRSLKYLYLEKTKFTRITARTFSHLDLTKLFLVGNFLSSIPDGAFDRLVHLKKLVLDHNQIETISENTFSPHLRNNLDEILLGDNPFRCSCDILWFQRWWKSDPHRFPDRGSNGYLCDNFNNLSLADFVLNDQACLLGSDAAAFTISITCLLITFLLLFTILFRFRWHMRLWLYEVCRGWKRRRTRGRRFRYDVFVSYAEENAQWVELELLPRLEGEWGLRVCVHHRDFVPGKHIVDNISDCVSDSDRLLLVFSPFFAQSEWCQFELKYCQACAMERDDVMVLVVMQGMESRHMTSAMLAVLRTTTFLEWADLQDARVSFWGRLRLALMESEERDEEEA